MQPVEDAPILECACKFRAIVFINEMTMTVKVCPAAATVAKVRTTAHRYMYISSSRSLIADKNVNEFVPNETRLTNTYR